MPIEYLARRHEDISHARGTTEEKTWTMRQFVKYEEKDKVLRGYCFGADVFGPQRAL